VKSAFWVLVIAVVCICTGCADTTSEAERVLLQLGTSDARGELRTTTREIDFGEPLVRQHLTSGWSIDERWGGGESVVWSVGGSSVVTFNRFIESDETMTFRCSPFVGGQDDRRKQVVGVTLNGRFLQSITLSPGFNRYSVALQSERLRQGVNALQFDYAYSRYSDSRPDENADLRDVSVAWDWLRFESVDPSVASGLMTSGDIDGVVTVPLGGRLDFFALVPPEARLVWDGVTPTDQVRDRSELRMTVEIGVGEDSDPSLYQVQVTRYPEAGSVDIGNRNTDAVRVSFRPSMKARVGDPRPVDSSSEVSVLHPRIVVPERKLRNDRAAIPRQGERGDTTREPLDSPATRPNVILYLIDTLRTDRLQTYGFAMPTSPRIVEFAAQGVTFNHAFAQSSWTKTSVASILTGRLPLVHRVIGRDDAMPETIPVLPEILLSEGYDTLGISTNPNISTAYGFQRGFDAFQYLNGMPHELAHAVTNAFFEWLDAGDRSYPFFAYLHTMDPHDPYRPLPEYRDRFAPVTCTSLDAPRPKLIREELAKNPGVTLTDIRDDLESLYAAEIAQNDEEVGRLVQGLRERRLFDNTLIILVSDHGEEFLDHGKWAHGKSLYREVLHVPLVVKLDGNTRAGDVVNQTVQHVDLFHSILHRTGTIPPTSDGIDIFSIGSGSGGEPAQGVYSYLSLDGNSFEGWIDGARHLILHDPEGIRAPVERYNLGNDFDELIDLGSIDDPWTGLMTIHLLESRAYQLAESYEGEVARKLDADMEEQLRALGYVE
jgi:arylsulfatase A-like enzyme